MATSDPTSPQTQTATLQNLSVEDIVEIEKTLQIEPAQPTQTPADATPTPSTIPILPIMPVKTIPVFLRKNAVSGRYIGYWSNYKLELRVDVDGQRPLKKISGDFWSTSGTTSSYYGSFMVDNPTISITNSVVTVTGQVKATFPVGFPIIQVTIPRTIIFLPRAAATLTFKNSTGQQGATYVCQPSSYYFRTVTLERDYQQSVTGIFNSYNTGALPSGGPARTLDVVSAFAEAGVEILLSGAVDMVASSEAGADPKWTDSELHAAMVKHFSLWKDEPQWKVWQLAANQYNDPPGWVIYGIMFDQQGKQRQGSAVFYKWISGSTPEKLRQQLYTHVHELGHCFNLLHSWQKALANPPGTNVPWDLSWMNYPQNYPAGTAAFWAAFNFQFSDKELVHIRHGFLNNVIMGGSNFGINAAFSYPADSTAFADNTTDNSGLQLEIESPKPTFEFGEPVVIELKLATTNNKPKAVHPFLHPKMGMVAVAIRSPTGEVAVYQPLLEHFASAEPVILNAENPKIYESAYIGSGRDGFYFNQSGEYNVRTVYSALDGSRIVSNVLPVVVRSPKANADEDIAALFRGDEQATLLQLMGSDSEFLAKGNKAFDEVIEKFPDHSLTMYAKFIKGYNLGREFKTITHDKKIIVRKPEPAKCADLLDAVIDLSEKGKGLDNISLNQTMRQLAATQIAAGKKREAEATMKRMVKIFENKNLKPFVIKKIQKQANDITALIKLQ